ncbi:hypothetical protein [Frankia sp. Cj3]|uniref:hypothetical protein n=1 Tax=Frankia sp. Cj3 TaxID=2880976 RepID=UPI001EF61777|nr:hypothetical protein [Frankia sp. Cj3]
MTAPTSTTGAEGEPAPVRSSWHVGVHVGSDWSARCYTYPDTRPILALDTGRVHLDISAAGGAVTTDHIEFAHALVQAANDYLIDCERILLDGTTDTAQDGSAIAA